MSEAIGPVDGDKLIQMIEIDLATTRGTPESKGWTLGLQAVKHWIKDGRVSLQPTAPESCPKCGHQKCKSKVCKSHCVSLGEDVICGCDCQSQTLPSTPADKAAQAEKGNANEG